MGEKPDEQPNETDTAGKEVNKPVEKSDEPLSLIEKAEKVRDEIKAENDRRERILEDEKKLRANDLLGGKSGGHVETKPKPQTDRDYSDKLDKGEVDPLKEDGFE